MSGPAETCGSWAPAAWALGLTSRHAPAGGAATDAADGAARGADRLRPGRDLRPVRGALGGSRLDRLPDRAGARGQLLPRRAREGACAGAGSRPAGDRPGALRLS